MSIQSITFSNAISFLQQHTRHLLTRQQSRILFIASTVLTLLATYYLLKCKCFKAKPLNGPGKLTKEGRVYEGCFKDGKLNGAGSITYINGMKAVGQFEDDLFEGSGKFFAENGSLMVEGDFTKGILDGKAKIVLPNQEVFEGEFNSDTGCGSGTFKAADGTTYEGRYWHGQKDGSGKITEQDGTVKRVRYDFGYLAEAEIVFDEPEAINLSKNLTKEGDADEGNIHDGTLDGSAAITYPLEIQALGQVEDDLLDDPDRLIPQDNSLMVEGASNQGILEASLKFVLSNVDLIEGYYDVDTGIGCGKFKAADGTTYEGRYSRGQKDGMGIVTELDGTSIKVWYYMGLLKGSEIVIEEPEEKNVMAPRIDTPRP